MTARTGRQDAVQIKSEGGDDPKQVVARYCDELAWRGHKITRAKHLLTCKQCQKTARVYYFPQYTQDKHWERVTIYSNFTDDGEDQCVAKQFNLHGALAWLLGIK